MRLPCAFFPAALLVAVPLAGCATTASDETRLLEERRAWWAMPNHGLFVDDIRPLATVAGRKSSRLPNAMASPDLASAALASVANTGTVALLVWYDGALRFEHYAAGYDATMLSAPASMPKPVLALAIGAAVDRGLIDIDVPISRWIPEWVNDARGEITVRQALQMRSGLAKYAKAADGGPGEALMLGTRLEDFVLSVPLARQPGSEFDYNNADNALAALVLQRTIDVPYAEWLSHTIWQPIGAGDAKVWLDRPDGMARTFCCLLATPRDWVRVGLLLKNEGRAGGAQVISPEWIAAMTAPSPTNPQYGFQIWCDDPAQSSRGYGSGGSTGVPKGEPYLVDDVLIFDGAGGQRIYISKKADLVIVRIGEFAPDWHDSALPNAVLRTLGQNKGPMQSRLRHRPQDRPPRPSR